MGGYPIGRLAYLVNVRPLRTKIASSDEMNAFGAVVPGHEQVLVGVDIADACDVVSCAQTARIFAVG
jgi:hypothetical protein